MDIFFLSLQTYFNTNASEGVGVFGLDVVVLVGVELVPVAPPVDGVEAVLRAP